MDISSSKCNGGSESGWTNYLDQSSLSANYFQRTSEFAEYEGKEAPMEEEEEEEEEEEDLSMVSDASSGPPHYHHDCFDQRSPENWYPSVSSSFQINKESRNKTRVKECCRKNEAPHLDDTASSPVLTYAKKKATQNGTVDNAFDISHGFSASVKGKPKFRKHLSFFESSRNEAPAQPGCFDEEEPK